MKCKYGCGEIALYGLRCALSPNSCKVIRKKNSEAARRSWLVNPRLYENFPEESKKRMAWSKGATKETDIRVKNQAKKITGVRKISDKEKLNKQIYRENCCFELGFEINKVLGYDLLVKHGMFHKIKNKGGVVRDHRFSVRDGYKNNVSPSIMRHPANCRFLIAAENAKKTFISEITYAELLKEIENWRAAQVVKWEDTQP